MSDYVEYANSQVIMATDQFISSQIKTLKNVFERFALNSVNQIVIGYLDIPERLAMNLVNRKFYHDHVPKAYIQFPLSRLVRMGKTERKVMDARRIYLVG